MFASQVDLAQVIGGIKNSGFQDKSPDAIRVFLNQVLRPGTGPGRRKPSPNLKSALRIAIQQRAADPSQSDEIADRLITALDEQKSAPDEKPLDHSEQWLALIDAAENASRTLVFTPRPAEVRSSEPHASMLTNILIDRLFGAPTDTSECAYEFFLKDEVTAQRMLSNLCSSIASSKGISLKDASALLDKAQNLGKLSVSYFLDACFVPSMCVMDPDTSYWRAFNLYYHDRQAVSVATLDNDCFDEWYRSMFVRLRNRSVETSSVKLHSTAPGFSSNEPAVTTP